jgi:hypothetical protein
MQNFNYITGRDYGAPQVLVISAPAAPTDDLVDIELVPVSFSDSARGIAGTVEVFTFDLLSEQALGRAVLAEYDAGRYTAN